MGASAGAFNRIRSGQENHAQSMRKRHAERWRRRHRHAEVVKRRKLRGKRVSASKHHHRRVREPVSIGSACLAGFGLLVVLAIGIFFAMPFFFSAAAGPSVLFIVPIYACLLPFAWLSASTLLRAARA